MPNPPITPEPHSNSDSLHHNVTGTPHPIPPPMHCIKDNSGAALPSLCGFPNQSSIPSSALGATEGSSSPPTQISNFRNQTDKAARPWTAWRAEADSQHRLTSQANLCSEVLVIQEHRTTSDASNDKKRPPTEDIATHMERPEDVKPQSIAKSRHTPSQMRYK